MTEWTTVADPTTAWSTVTNTVTETITTPGTPLGLLLSITHISVVTITISADDTIWSDVADPSTSWTTV